MTSIAAPLAQLSAKQHSHRAQLRIPSQRPTRGTGRKLFSRPVFAWTELRAA